VIAVHTRISERHGQALSAAFEATVSDPSMVDAVRAIFGATSFGRRPIASYELLRSEVERGVDSGVLPASAAFLSTRPPPPP
jgi:hypothetical protein